ncbi:RDD family protein [Arthrobacter sp. LAPM80]|uniref:RDD family protein n=1 Tax=Arthrobacter sp. LAPM80 TaxID=3141788 RepID=UPI00398B1C7D
MADPCRNCGTVLAPGAAFCTLCGAAVANRAASPAPSSVAQASTITPVSMPGIVPVGVTSQGPLLAPQQLGADPRIAAAAALVPGGAGLRFAAKIIDGILPFLLLTVAVIIGSFTVTVTRVGNFEQYNFLWLSTFVGIAALLSIAYGIWLWLWEAKAGKTPGNILLGLRTTNMDGGPAGILAIFLRNLIIGLGGIVPTIGPIIVIISNVWDANGKRQGWHDKVAHTLVFNVKGGRDPLETGGIAGRADFTPAPVPTISQVHSPLARPAQGSPFAPPSSPQPRIPVDEGPITSVPGVARPTEPFQPVQPAAAQQSAATAESDDDAGETRMRPHAPSQSLRLTFDDGRTEDISAVALIGRNPAGYDGEMIQRLIPVQDSGRSVSKTHLHLRVGGEGLWVTDRNSTNGSAITNPGGVRTPLTPGAPALAGVGSRVDFGDRSLMVGPA